eukprot:4725933-Prymnesium_polylepis.1
MTTRLTGDSAYSSAVYCTAFGSRSRRTRNTAHGSRVARRARLRGAGPGFGIPHGARGSGSSSG